MILNPIQPNLNDMKNTSSSYSPNRQPMVFTKLGFKNVRFSRLTNLILTFFSAFIATSSFAQYQSYFGENTTSWKTQNLFFTFESGSLDSIAYWNEMSQNGVTYKLFKIYSVEASFDGLTILGNGFIEDGSILWLRESDDHALLYMNFGIEDTTFGQDQVVSNMNLELGDSFGSLDVASIETDSEGRKVITLSNAFETNTMREGVGADYFVGASSFQSILCQTKDGATTYTINDVNLSPYCSGIIMSNSDRHPDIRSAVIYPNPARGSLQIELETAQTLNYAIRNTLGMEVQNGQLQTAKSNIDLSNLPGGIYFLQVDGMNGMAKFLKVD